MTWKLTDAELRAVTQLPPERRYNYAIKRFADQEKVWSLRNEDGWVLAADDEGNEIVPVWPHFLYAAQSALGDWANTVPQAIDLDAWLEKWLPGMIRDKRKVCVFPVPSGQGVVVSPERLESDLGEELSKYELGDA